MDSVEGILKELEGMGNPSTKKMLMNNHGVLEPCFGVKIGDMKSIVKRIKVNHELALGLYDTGNYDAMYLAGLIADDQKMTKRDLQKWANNAKGGSLAGYTVAWTASGSRFGWELGLKWIESKKEHVATCGWNTLSCLMTLKQDDELDLTKVKSLIHTIEKDIHDTPDFIRYAKNHFLISVGCGVESLTKEVVEIAKRIGPVSANIGNNQCQIPSIIDYIKKVEKRGYIGRKRKSVKC